MTFTELISVLAEKTGLPKTKVKRVMEAFLEESKEVLGAGESIKLTGFGSLYSHLLRPRPLFGKGMSVPRRTIRFKESRRHGKAKRRPG